MKNIFNLKFNGLLAVVLLLAGLCGFSACTENIDESSAVIRSEQTAIEYIEGQPQFSQMKAIFDRVKMGHSSKASSISSLLSSRGNYTVFIADNDAVNAYVKELGYQSIDELTDDQAELIAQSCILDNGTSSAYESADFPADGTFPMSNLQDRLISCAQDTLAEYWINSNSKVLKADIEVSNGYVHVVSNVVAPSTNQLSDMIAKTPNLQVMAKLLELTGWGTVLSPNKPYDEVYENLDKEPTVKELIVGSGEGPWTIPQHRYLGFTGFVETDDTYAQELGVAIQKDEENNITNWDEVQAALLAKCRQAYPEQTAEDPTDQDNALNRFVAYHFVNGSMAYDRMIPHVCEYGYTPKDMGNPWDLAEKRPCNVYNYFVTLGKHQSLVKVTEVGDASTAEPDAIEHPLYVNRISRIDNARFGKYNEIGVDYKGFRIASKNDASGTTYANNALNGYYHVISGGLLFNDEANRRRLGSERIRMDYTTLFHEMVTNNMKFSPVNKTYYRIPKGYFDNLIRESADTHPYYLYGRGGGWNENDGDEYLFVGQSDFVIKLPPMPQSGTYEIRLGVSHNDQRNMVQLYFGDDPDHLSPVGLPYDQRQPIQNLVLSADVSDPDSKTDEDANIEKDKNYRNQGYMCMPKSECKSGSATDLRSVSLSGGSATCIRRILCTTYMEAGKTYYLRYKSCLKNSSSQLFMDILEFCPSNIYNGTTPEDVW